jgi:mannose-1-phosphate guanylyltransferase/mannose-1-phosphate guanylyltransferase/phosphomannomutase
VPFHIHELHEYWNDVGSLAELRRGTFDALAGELRLQMEGEQVAPGVIVAGSSPLREDTDLEGPAWIGRDVQLGAGVRLMGPLVLGDGASIGDGAQLRESILFPGTEVAPASILIGAIAGHRGILASLRRSGEERHGAPPASSAEADRGNAQASS